MAAYNFDLKTGLPILPRPTPAPAPARDFPAPVLQSSTVLEAQNATDTALSTVKFFPLVIFAVAGWYIWKKL